MIVHFQNWINECESAFIEWNIKYGIFTLNVKGDYNGMYLDMIFAEHEARITVWESGEVDTEFLDSCTGDILIYDSFVCDSETTLKGKVNKFLAKVVKMVGH